LNRTTSGRYHPGSVFKIAVAAGGLESGVIDGQTLIEDTGVIKIGDYSYSNWLWTKRGGTDGMVDVVKALKKSNDIFFYKLGERMGPDSIKEWAMKFGYGQKTGVEVFGEIDGVVPDEEWKKEARGENWFLGNTYHYAIGQGDLGVTPLQVNMSTNIIAANGKKCKMSLLKDTKPECETVKIKSDNLELVKSGMLAACSEGGTAWPLFNFKTKIACKTGTAEVGDGSQDTHAWLTAFAPADNPEISITVMVERGGEGSDVAAPIVGDILKEWFGEPETKVPRYAPGTKSVVYE
jgi:penicillin-binding protein 2